ncbi:hypothetical protein JHK82_050687 [Glycine max]|nr:hypothetical protein JHK86_050553 [Glycine max]KAG4936476.1 hypothetical protein JHK85_051395 [Glycine max]KAG5091909.1 hypothetical protein JHK82_050687 [Glycine max]KAG5095002.1 hypothetical protein JHK84_050590 [Glycine max]
MSNVPNRFVDDWGTSLGHGSVCGLKNEWNMGVDRQGCNKRVLFVCPNFFNGDPFDPENENRPLPVWIKDHEPEKDIETTKLVIEAIKKEGASAIGATAPLVWGTVHPPFHITPEDRKIYRNDTANFPYLAYHYYCAPGNAKHLEQLVSTCDPYNNPQAQEIFQLLLDPIWGAYGYPTQKEDGWVGDPRIWELDVGGTSIRLYFYQVPRNYTSKLGNVLGPKDYGPASRWLNLIHQALNSNTSSQSELIPLHAVQVNMYNSAIIAYQQNKWWATSRASFSVRKVPTTTTG